MTHDDYQDTYLRDILEHQRVFAVVGASPKPARPSFSVMKFLLARGYNVIPVNPGHAGKAILGQRVFASLGDIGQPIDIVDIFRRSEAVLPVTREAIGIGAKIIWMQVGVRHDEAAKLAERAGLNVVMDRCPKIEYQRLFGEIDREG